MNTAYISAKATENEIKLQGTIYASKNLMGIVNIGGSYDSYKGEYNVVPARREQVLETQNKLLKENITIIEIPYSEVSNLGGGNTFYIARE